MGPYTYNQPKAPKNIARTQQGLGAITQGLGGVSNLIYQNQAMQAQANNINTTAPGAQTDAYGSPQYNIGSFQQAAESIHPQGADAGEIGSGALSGAQTGAAIGSIIPGVGTVIGGAVGAIGGALSSVFGGASRKAEQEKKKRLAEANLRIAQKNFNSSMEAFNNQRAAQQVYNDTNDPAQRQQNIYSYNSQY